MRGASEDAKAECRAARRARPAAVVPGQDGGTGDLLVAARRAATDHQQRHGQPITRDALRAQLGVSSQAASGLLRQFRASERGHPPGTSRAA